jgi:hypothetical protein
VPSDIERGIAAGFARDLTKPINIPEFFAKTESVLAEMPKTAPKPFSADRRS